MYHFVCPECGKEFADNKHKNRIFCSYRCSKVKHRCCGTRFYNIWCGMITRCNNPNTVYFSRYGGRGIKIIWKSFDEFKDDMYNLYLKHCDEYGEKNTSIDRVNNNGNYSKENCRWATPIMQRNNQREWRKLITYKNKTLTSHQWSKITNIAVPTLLRRINFYKWSIEKALTTPVGGKH